MTVDHNKRNQHIIYDYTLGPYNIHGSDQFACVFASNYQNNLPNNEFHITVHQLPDSQS